MICSILSRLASRTSTMSQCLRKQAVFPDLEPCCRLMTINTPESTHYAKQTRSNRILGDDEMNNLALD